MACWIVQYLKHFQTKQLPILERFALLISVTVIWAYAHLLTASGAYKHRPELTQTHCRTDRANLISSAPWLVLAFPHNSRVSISLMYFNVFHYARIVTTYFLACPIMGMRSSKA